MDGNKPEDRLAVFKELVSWKKPKDTHLKPIDTVALPKITRSPSRAVVRAGSRDSFGFGDDQGNLVRLQFIIVHRKEPTTRVEILKETDVHHHRFDDGPFDQYVLIRTIVHVRASFLNGLLHKANRLRAGVSLQSMIDPAAFHELHEIVLRDARSDVTSTVHGEVRAPWQRQVQPDESGLLVPEFRVPEVVRRYDGRVGNVVRLQLEHGRPLLRRLLDLRIALLVPGAVRRARMFRCARWQRFCGTRGMYTGLRDGKLLKLLKFLKFIENYWKSIYYQKRIDMVLWNLEFIHAVPIILKATVRPNISTGIIRRR